MCIYTACDYYCSIHREIDNTMEWNVIFIKFYCIDPDIIYLLTASDINQIQIESFSFSGFFFFLSEN